MRANFELYEVTSLLLLLFIVIGSLHYLSQMTQNTDSNLLSMLLKDLLR